MYYVAYSKFKNKAHIMDNDFEALCGNKPNMLSVSDEIKVLSEFTNQPDPDNQMCQTCKKSAMKILSVGGVKN